MYRAASRHQLQQVHAAVGSRTRLMRPRSVQIIERRYHQGLAAHGVGELSLRRLRTAAEAAEHGVKR